MVAPEPVELPLYRMRRDLSEDALSQTWDALGCLGTLQSPHQAWLPDPELPSLQNWEPDLALFLVDLSVCDVQLEQHRLRPGVLK